MPGVLKTTNSGKTLLFYVTGLHLCVGQRERGPSHRQLQLRRLHQQHLHPLYLISYSCISPYSYKMPRSTHETPTYTVQYIVQSVFRYKTPTQLNANVRTWSRIIAQLRGLPVYRIHIFSRPSLTLNSRAGHATALPRQRDHVCRPYLTL